MGQQQTAVDTNSWYLIADRGDTVVRVRPGMRLGETAGGDLSFDPSHAQLELNIAENGDLMLGTIDDHELESEAGARSRRGRLAHRTRTVIRLPNNDLQLDTDFVDPARTNDAPEILSVRLTGHTSPQKAGDFPKEISENPIDTKVPAGTTQQNSARPIQTSGTSAANNSQLEAKQDIPLPQRARLRSEPTPEPVANSISYRRTQPEGNPQRRILAVAAALIALAGVSLVLVLTDFSDEQPAVSLATVDASPPRTIERQTIPTIVKRSNLDAEAAPSPSPSPQRSTADPAVAESDARDEIAEQPNEQSSMPESVIAETTEPKEQQDSEPVTAPIIKPMEPPPVERGSNTQSEQTVEAAKIIAGPETSISEQPPTAASEPKQADDSAQKLAAQLDRDLIAADQALAEGQLVAPPQASAYTLYNRVLTLDPDSAEAKKGLQSVRQGLINRALAQLASNAFDDGRGSLQAAADAGANPQFVADLRGELDYRQRLTDAQAGRFESLYPFDQLVVISQEQPRLPRNLPPGSAVDVQFTVTGTGEVRDIMVPDTAPRNLERALLRALRKWRFEPVSYNGGPVPVRSSMRFTFPN